MKCSNCGKKVPKNSSYCNYCGKRVDNDYVLNQDDDYSFEFFDIFLIVLFVVYLASFIVSFITDFPVGSILIPFQLALVVIAQLINREVILPNLSKLAIVLTVCSFLFVFPIVVTLNKTNETVVVEDEKKNYNWDDVFLSDVLVEPNCANIDIWSNSSKYLSVEFENYSVSQFKQYMQYCTLEGFNIEVIEKDSYFSAYNQQGYHIQIDYYQYDNSAHLYLDAPQQYDDIYWPESNVLFSYLPSLDVSYGEIRKNDSDELSIFLAKIPTDYYCDYVDKCINYGFDEILNRTDTNFKAKNDLGYILEVSYEGFNTMLIDISEPEYEVSLIISVNSSVLSTDDISIYVDDNYKDFVESGASKVVLLNLNAGTHVITFKQYGIFDQNASIVIEVKDNSVFNLTVNSSLLSLEVYQNE